MTAWVEPRVDKLEREVAALKKNQALMAGLLFPMVSLYIELGKQMGVQMDEESMKMLDDAVTELEALTAETGEN